MNELFDYLSLNWNGVIAPILLFVALILGFFFFIYLMSQEEKKYYKIVLRSSREFPLDRNELTEWLLNNTDYLFGFKISGKMHIRFTTPAGQVKRDFKNVDLQPIVEKYYSIQAVERVTYLITLRSSNAFPYDTKTLVNWFKNNPDEYDEFLESGKVHIRFATPGGKKEQVFRNVDKKYITNELAKKMKNKDFVKKQRSLMTPELRMYILSRDNYTCQSCGFSVTDSNLLWQLEIDHIVPVSKGGRTEENNLQTLCRGCNAKKRDIMERPIDSGNVYI